MNRLILIIAIFSSISFTTYSQFVKDEGGFFSDSEVQQLDEILGELWSTTTVEVRLFTIDTLNGSDIKEYGLKIAKELAIGKAGVNNGILILLSRKDRKITILVGYGMEWIIDDKSAQELINVLVPYFKQDEYFKGISHVFQLISNKVSKVSWTINMVNISTISKELEGKVIEFKYSNPSKSTRFKYAIDTDPQFGADFKILINAKKEDYNLYYSKYMNNYISSILTQANIKIVARLVDYDKRKLELMGIINE